MIESIIKYHDIYIKRDNMIYPFELIMIFIIIGALEIIMGLPLMFGKIKPNWFYGFRLPKTMSNKEVWYKTNRYVGRDFIVAGMIVIIGALVVLMFQFDFDILEITMLLNFLLVVPLFAIIARGVIYIKKISD